MSTFLNYLFTFRPQVDALSVESYWLTGLNDLLHDLAALPHVHDDPGHLQGPVLQHLTRLDCVRYLLYIITLFINNYKMTKT
jgi:hypothetical protein